jgi:hypothetical protein
MHTARFIVVVVALSFTSNLRAEGDAWPQAASQANAKIERYAEACRSGDPLARRQATMELQADPAAIRLVNKHSSEEFKTRLNQDIGAVKAQTRVVMKERFAQQMGVSPDRVSFFEATNAPKPGDKVKVGQDWDLTIRVDGRDVPTPVARPIANQAYYEAATGRRPPKLRTNADGTVSAEALNRYAEAGDAYARAANDYAHHQALEVTYYQHPESYGGSTREGGAIITGPKGARLRDPAQISQVIEYKSAEAANLAEDRRTRGDHAGAAGRDLEQIRQSTKQFQSQVVPRVEAMGGEVPCFVKKGQEILRRVDSLEITPAQAREELWKMGETPESFIRKTAALVEAVQVLQAPASRGEAPPDIFVQNVRDRLARKGIDPDSFARGEGGSINNVNDALTALWQASTAADGAAQEGVRAMRAGEEPSRLRAAANAMAEATTIPGTLRGIEYGGNLRDKHVAAAERYHGSGLNAELTGRAMAVREFAGDLTGLNLGTRIGHEEIQNEERQAAREGREPNYTRSMLNGSVRGLGEVLMINTIARSANSVTPEEVNWQGQEQVLRAWVQGKMNENLKTMNGIKTRLANMAADGNPREPGFLREYERLFRHYDQARLAMANLADAAERQLGRNDPFSKALHVKVGKLPDMPSVRQIARLLPHNGSDDSSCEPSTGNSGQGDPGSEDSDGMGTGTDDGDGPDDPEDPDGPDEEPADPDPPHHPQPDDVDDPDDPECDCPEMESENSDGDGMRDARSDEDDDEKP